MPSVCWLNPMKDVVLETHLYVQYAKQGKEQGVTLERESWIQTNRLLRLRASLKDYKREGKKRGLCDRAGGDGMLAGFSD